MSMTPLPAASTIQSRDTILNIFHDITGLNIEDCIHFLHQYNWKLQNILDAFYSGKEFKNKSNRNPNKTMDKNTDEQESAQSSNLGSFYTKNNELKQLLGEDDHYYAQLLQKFGDADESARRYREECQIDKELPKHQKLEQKLTKEHTNTERIYHERQELLRCGIHSLNNLFQIPKLFTHQHLDGIVREFDGKHNNNEYGILSIGDYDLRILIEAINRCGYLVRQINFFNGEPLQKLPWDSYFGVLINLNGAHWFTIKNLNKIYYNLDSTFTKPLQIGPKDDLVKYLIRLIQSFNNIYIFVVFHRE